MEINPILENRIRQIVDEAVKRVFAERDALANFPHCKPEDFIERCKEIAGSKGNRENYRVGKTAPDQVFIRENAHNAKFLLICLNPTEEDSNRIEYEADEAGFDAGDPGKGGQGHSTFNYIYRKGPETDENS